MSEIEQKLTPTKSSCRLRGIVAGMTSDYAYKEGVVEKGKMKGKKYRSLRVQLQTSPTNRITLELFGMEQDQITVFKRDEKGMIVKGDQKRVAFDKRKSLPAGYHILDTNFEIETDDDGKTVIRELVRYDAVLYLRKYLKDGDSIYASGSMEFSEYTNNKTNETKLQSRYTIRSINKTTTPIDFEHEKFEELSSFEQEIVFVDSEVSDGRVFVTGRTIAYGDKFTDVQFVCDPQGDEDIERTAKAFVKGKFGDFVKISGNLVHRVELVETEEKVSTGPFGEKRANGYKKRAIRNYIQEYQIVGADNDTYESEKYTEDDFVQEVFAQQETGKKNPFEETIEDDDLPF